MLKIGNKFLTREEIKRYFGSLQQVAGLKRFTYQEGKADGLEAVECRTGTGLRYHVLLSRGMDIGLCEYRGIPIHFRSAVGESSPKYFEATGDEWLRNFGGGLLVTCGLNYLGAPDTDQGESLGLHGRISNTPAEEVSLDSIWNGDECTFLVKGKTREAKTLSSHLLISRKISSKLGENKIILQDTISNEGFHQSPLMLLYHINIGYPLLDKESRLYAPSLQVIPRDKQAEKGMDRYNYYSAPEINYPDTVFYHQLKTDATGWSRAAFINSEKNLGIYIYYDSRYLPHFIQWKFLEMGNYVTGMEPSNCLLEGRSKERKQRNLVYLEPGEKQVIQLELGLLISSDDLEKEIKNIENF